MEVERVQEAHLQPGQDGEVTEAGAVTKVGASTEYCGKEYAANSSSHGTTNLGKHLKVCLNNPYRVVDKKKQKTLAIGRGSEDDPNSVSFKLVDFSQEKTRLALAKMIIIDELPFKHVENEGFKMFMGEAQPKFKIPSRIFVARDCLRLYFDEKETLKSLLSANNQMVSLTTDTWTSIQNMNYTCTQNWIKSPKVIGLDAELVEVEKIESELAGLVTIDVGVTAVELNTITNTRN